MHYQWNMPHWYFPDCKVHVAHMGPTWVPWAPCWPHVGPTNHVMRGLSLAWLALKCTELCKSAPNLFWYVLNHHTLMQTVISGWKFDLRGVFVWVMAHVGGDFHTLGTPVCGLYWGLILDMWNSSSMVICEDYHCIILPEFLSIKLELW